MKIATMVRGYLPVPRPKDILYAPLDIALLVAQGLAKRGHEVDFYAPKGSKPGVPVKHLGISPLFEDGEKWQAHLLEIKPHIHYMPLLLGDYPFVSEMYEQASRGKYDILYFHHPELPLLFAKQYPSVVTASTLHDPFLAWYQQMFQRYASPNSHLVAISNHQQRDDPASFAGTVYNGVDTEQFSFSEKPGEYLLCAGRVVPEKGFAEAVQLARKTGERLVMVGLLFSKDRPYFDKHIKPFLNDRIQYVGYVEREKLAPYYQKAKALLMPVTWGEPFGMTMTEAMACGTPVIALCNGSVPEVVADGETGFVVDTVEGMAQAIGKIDTISRTACRQRVERLFSVEKMVDGYEALFQRLIKSTSRP